MICQHNIPRALCSRCQQLALEARQTSLEGTVEQWTEARQALSRRVDLVEQTHDQHGDLLTTMQGQISDLQERAVFAQRSPVDQRTIVVRLPAEDVRPALLALVGAVGTYAIEILE